MVTRCPVQVKMHKNKGGGGGGAAWKARASLAGGLAAPTIVPTPEDLATHVAQLMNQATEGTETGLSEQLVAVEIEAPTLPDLTLIDLPGIVRTRIAGQGAGTLAAINRMVDAYLSQPATIVLAVVPANQDIATQEVLERAAAADPEGLRTLAVLTKPDLVGLGNEDEVAEVCSNRRKPLKLGYVMVKNNADPAGGADHDAEERYFREHPVFSKIDRKLLGFRNLTVKLTALFAEHIKHFLPHIKFQLQRGLERAEATLETLGAPVAARADAVTKKRELVRLCAKAVGLVREACRGEYKSAFFMGNDRLRIRAQSDHQFAQLRAQVEGRSPAFGTPEFEADLRRKMEGLRGRELPGLFSSQLFYGFMADQVEEWRPHVDGARLFLQGALETVVGLLCREPAGHYPRLVEALDQLVHETISQLEDKIVTQVDQALERELDPFTASDDLREAMERTRFLRFDQAMGNALRALPQNANQETCGKLVARSLGQWYLRFHGAEVANRAADMATVLQAYWGVAAKRVTDNCCMIFETNLLAKFVDELEMRFLEFAQTQLPAELDALFFTDPEVAKKRELLAEKRTAFSKALAGDGQLPWLLEGSADGESYSQLSTAMAPNGGGRIYLCNAHNRQFRYLRVRSADPSAFLDVTMLDFAGKLFPVKA